MPYPIQLGPLTDRLRKFFRIRGKATFMLDEVVVPVALVQDLTKGPYQAGVTPAARNIIMPQGSTTNPTMTIAMQDKPGGTVTPVLPDSFKNNTFSITWMEISAEDTNIINQPIIIGIIPRSQIALLTPTENARLVSIQNNDGPRRCRLSSWDSAM